MHIPLYDSQTTPASAYCEKCRQEVYHGEAGFSGRGGGSAGTASGPQSARP